MNSQASEEIFEAEDLEEIGQSPEDDADDEEAVGEYDITASPNDFNVSTIVDFIERKVFIIPGFQRNYVWDLKRASRLIESVVLGLPIPQIFLYESSRNKFLVIDGQQRLMSLYFFVKKRFPVMEKRGQLRRIFDEHGEFPAAIREDDAYFVRFALRLPSRTPEQNKLSRRNYDTLGDLKDTFDLRTIRCVVIKQNEPKDDDSSVYEIFNRLNTGGMNLAPQEIRASLYHSPFYDLIYRINAHDAWRRTIGVSEPDLRMRDIEVLVRACAVMIQFDQYKSSMGRFLNQFSKLMKDSKPDLSRLTDVLSQFFLACAHLPDGIFGTRSKKVNVSIFEAVMSAICRDAYLHGGNIHPLEAAAIDRLKQDKDFITAASSQSTHKTQVEKRLRIARSILVP